MGPKAFFKIVEIRTKSASLLPFLAGTLFCVWRFGQFDPINALLMFVSLCCIDPAVTALNHHAQGEGGPGMLQLDSGAHPRAGVRRLIALLLLGGAASGALLALRTGPITLVLGTVSFLVGILYSAGPLPLERTPLGEVLSGLFMGFVIVFLACHIHLGDSFNAYVLAERLILEADWQRLGMIALLSLPLVTAIFNLMLANNICDETDDRAAGRFTLPVMIGRRRSLGLFRLVYLIGAGAGLAALALRILPLSGLLLIPAYVRVCYSSRRFARRPNKRTTFSLAVSNLNWIGGALVLSLMAALILAL